MTALETYQAACGKYYWRLALDASRHGHFAEAVAYRHLAVGDSVEVSLQAAARRARRASGYMLTGR